MKMNLSIRSFANAVGKSLDDSPAEKIYVVIIFSRSHSGSSLYQVDGNKYSRADSSESRRIFDATSGDGFFSKNALKALKKPGIYVFYYKNKELTDYKFVEKKSDYTIKESGGICGVVLNKLFDLTPEGEEELDELKKNLTVENIFNSDNDGADKTNYSYNGIQITMIYDVAESREYIDEDYKIMQGEIERVIKERFIPWLKGKKYADRDDQKIFDGLKLYQITYCHIKKHGEFSFSFESGNDYTSDMLEAAGFDVDVSGGEVKIDSVNCYDI